MTNDQIERFLQIKNQKNEPVKVSFKSRKSVVGMFIKTADYDELKSKNFWRIVGSANLESYRKSRDMNLARIFNGSEMTRLSVSNEEDND